MTKTKDIHEMMKKSEEVSRILKCLAHPLRLKVLCCLLEGEKSVNELVEYCGGSQSGMSQYLGKLKAENVLQSSKEGTFIYYSLKDQNLKKLIKALKEIYCT